MFPKINFTKTEAYKNLAQHFGSFSGLSNNSEKNDLRALFAADPARFEKFSITFEDILLDYSKNRITAETKALLVQLAKECGLEEAMAAMFSGERINVTENRPVLHTALRNQSDQPVYVDGKDVMPDVKRVLTQMKAFTEKIISGE